MRMQQMNLAQVQLTINKMKFEMEKEEKVALREKEKK